MSEAAEPARNGEISHWMVSASQAARTRPSLGDDISADVCIIGGGYTGLWLAYHLTEFLPGCKVVILERERLGYGASGRNAGWLSPLVPGNRKVFASSAGTRQAAIDLQRAMLGAVDDVLNVMKQESIDASAKLSGNLVIARTPAALHRLHARREGDLAWGFLSDEIEQLDKAGVAAHINVEGALGGLFYPRAARINPVGLVFGLAEVLERRGVTIYEQTEAVSMEQGTVHTRRGATVRAGSILRCTEAYTGSLGNDRRRIIPINSSIIATEPIPEATWERIGWKDDELFSDAAHVFMYSQRTDDKRIVMGGRGNPYRYGSNVGTDGRVDLATRKALVSRLHSLFPQTADVPIAHSWSGVIGVTRDWCASVEFDRQSKIGWAQGYAGHGVTSAYLAALSLAESVAGVPGPAATLPWVGRRARRWEVEPFRWLGVHGMYRLFAFADSFEERNQSERTSLLARVGSRLAGLHE